MSLDTRYKILEKIGSGSFATVYRARDTELGREVAIKQLHDEFVNDPQRMERFWQEALLKVLGAESLDLEELSRRRKRALGDQSFPKGLGDFFFEEDDPLHPGR